MQLENVESIKIVKPGKKRLLYFYYEPEIVEAKQGKCPHCKQNIIIPQALIEMISAIYCNYCHQKIELT